MCPHPRRVGLLEEPRTWERRRTRRAGKHEATATLAGTQPSHSAIAARREHRTHRSCSLYPELHHHQPWHRQDAEDRAGNARGGRWRRRGSTPTLAAPGTFPGGDQPWTRCAGQGELRARRLWSVVHDPSLARGRGRASPMCHHEPTRAAGANGRPPELPDAKGAARFALGWGCGLPRAHAACARVPAGSAQHARLEGGSCRAGRVVRQIVNRTGLRLIQRSLGARRRDRPQCIANGAHWGNPRDVESTDTTKSGDKTAPAIPTRMRRSRRGARRSIVPRTVPTASLAAPVSPYLAHGSAARSSISTTSGMTPSRMGGPVVPSPALTTSVLFPSRYTPSR